MYRLTASIYKETGKRACVLIDEYDIPVSHANSRGYFDKAIPFLQVFYGKLVKGNDYLEKAIVTGIIRIAKQSLFPEANNFILDDGIQGILSEPGGFSYEETKELLKEFGDESYYDQVNRWYGGYRLGDTMVVNPWSVLSYLLYRKRFASYRVSTASNSELKTIFGDDSAFLDALNKLLGNGQTYPVDISENTNYQQPHATVDGFLLCLRAAGYLTLSDFDVVNKAILTIPNKEISLTLPNEIISHYHGGDNGAMQAFASLKKAFINGDEKALEELIRENVLSSLSYYEFSDEKAYQVIMLIVLALLFDEAIVKSEVNAGDGRCDIMISPKNERGFGSVLGIKHLKSRTSAERLCKSAESALSRTLSHRYYEELQKKGTPPRVMHTESPSIRNRSSLGNRSFSPRPYGLKAK